MFPDPKRVTLCLALFISASATAQSNAPLTGAMNGGAQRKPRLCRRPTCRRAPWCSRSRRRCRRPRRARAEPEPRPEAVGDISALFEAQADAPPRGRRAAHAGAGVLRGLEPVSGEFFPSHSRGSEADGNQEHQLISMRSARPGRCPTRGFPVQARRSSYPCGVANMSTRSIRYVPRSRQRACMTVAVVFAVLVGLVLLGVAQLGYGYYMKREVRRPRIWPRCRPMRVLGTGAAADCSRPRRRACRRRWPICRISWIPFPRPT